MSKGKIINSKGKSNGKRVSAREFEWYDVMKDPNRVITKDQVAEKVGVGIQTIDRLIDRFGFPKAVRISTGIKAGMYGWLISEVDHWLLHEAPRRELTPGELKECERLKDKPIEVTRLNQLPMQAPVQPPQFPTQATVQTPTQAPLPFQTQRFDPKAAWPPSQCNSNPSPYVMDGLRAEMNELLERLIRMESYLGAGPGQRR